MYKKAFIYDGETFPVLPREEQEAFFRNMEKAIIYSLEKRKLLTASEREQSIRFLELPGRLLKQMQPHKEGEKSDDGQQI